MGRIFHGGIPYSGNASHNYSTDEQVVGTWVDGKILYEKTVVIESSSLSSGENTLLHNISNVDYICGVDGIVFKNGNGSTPITTKHLDSIWSCSIYNLSRTSFVFYIGSSLSQYVTKVYIHFRYTKTSS